MHTEKRTLKTHTENAHWKRTLKTYTENAHLRAAYVGSVARSKNDNRTHKTQFSMQRLPKIDLSFLITLKVRNIH